MGKFCLEEYLRRHSNDGEFARHIHRNNIPRSNRKQMKSAETVRNWSENNSTKSSTDRI